MLYIRLENGQQIKWNVGTETPTSYADEVYELQADGDELDYISDKFGLIAAPRPKGQQVVRYYGDQARFILGNL